MGHDAGYRHLLFCDLLLEQEDVPLDELARALEQALARPEEGQPLATVAGDASERIEAQVRALHASASSWLEALRKRGSAARLAVLDAHAGPVVRRTLLALGAHIGMALRPMAENRYRDFVPVGKGGMGIVYWAVDAELNREVAVKVIHPAPRGAGTDVTPISPAGIVWPPQGEDHSEAIGQLEARFLQEAWITGSMTHPGIVPVYELGKTDAGVPYYTMRFVEGRRTLADAIRSARAEPLEQRLLLLDAFLAVCDAIRYAHSRGVLHRDIKPSNVVLGEFGEVVVVDWGLARVLDGPDNTRGVLLDRIESLREASDLHTLGSALGTPGYMAPEAAGGDVDAITARSDVYSLATILFEILTGSLPIPVQNLRQYLEDIRTGPAPDARDVEAEVPARLAALCREGLQTDPQARVPSVEALAEGVRAWRREAATERELHALAREAETALVSARATVGSAALPQLERASHAGYRMLELRADDATALGLLERVEALRTQHLDQLERRARHRLLKRVSVAAVALAAVAALAVAFVLEQRRQEAADARGEAAASRDRAEGVMTFMVGDLLEDLEPLGRLDLLTKVGARARAYYGELPPEEASAASLENRSLALRKLGDAFARRGNLPDALTAYQEARESARELERRALGGAGNFQRALAEAAMGSALARQGHPTRAREVLAVSQSALAALGQTGLDDPELLGARSEGAAHLARILVSEGHWEEAVAHSRDALALATRAAALDVRDLARRHTVLRRRMDLAQIRYGPERAEDAAEMQSVIEEVDERSQETPDDVRWRALAADGRLRLAYLLQGIGRYPEAAVQAARAAVDLQSLVRRDPANLLWASALASARRAEGDALFSQGSVAPAHTLYREAYERMGDLSRADPSNAAWLNKLITCCDRLVVTGERLAAPTGELVRWRGEAVAHATRLLERDPENAKHRHLIAYTTHHYAVRVLLAGRLDEGLALAKEAGRLLRVVLVENPDNEEASVLLGWNTQLEMRAYRDQDRRADALELAQRDAQILAELQARRPDFWTVRDVLLSLWLAHVELLLQGGALEADRAVALLEATEHLATEGLARPDLSALARHALEERRAAAQELRQRLGR